MCVCVLLFTSVSLHLFSQVIPAWNISPIKKTGDVKKVRLPFYAPLVPAGILTPDQTGSSTSWLFFVTGSDEVWVLMWTKVTDFCLQPPQFVDILLAEEDSSDEEYRPDDEDEDETAEDVRLCNHECDQEADVNQQRCVCVCV